MMKLRFSMIVITILLICAGCDNGISPPAAPSEIHTDNTISVDSLTAFIPINRSSVQIGIHNNKDVTLDWESNLAIVPSVTWLEVHFPPGDILPGQSSEATVILDREGMTPGLHYATLSLFFENTSMYDIDMSAEIAAPGIIPLHVNESEVTILSNQHHVLVQIFNDTNLTQQLGERITFYHSAVWMDISFVQAVMEPGESTWFSIEPDHSAVINSGLYVGILDILFDDMLIDSILVEAYF